MAHKHTQSGRAVVAKAHKVEMHPNVRALLLFLFFLTIRSFDDGGGGGCVSPWRWIAVSG